MPLAYPGDRGSQSETFRPFINCRDVAHLHSDPMKTDPTDDLILRPARASDIPRIETLHLITFEDHRRRETGFDQTPFIDEFTAAIRAPDGARRVAVAERRGQFAGFVAWTILGSYWKGRTLAVNDLSVLPQSRASGPTTSPPANCFAARASTRSTCPDPPSATANVCNALRRAQGTFCFTASQILRGFMGVGPHPGGRGSMPRSPVHPLPLAPRPIT